MDDRFGTSADVIPNTYDPRMMWGASEFDARHILVFSYLYDLAHFQEPLEFSGKLLRADGKSAASPSFRQAAMRRGTRHRLCPRRNSIPILAARQRPVLDRQRSSQNHWHVWIIRQWFSTKNPMVRRSLLCPRMARSITPAFATSSTAGFQNWNLGLFKSFPIDEQRGFQFRAEAFNFINHPEIGVEGSGGGVNSTRLARILER